MSNMSPCPFCGSFEVSEAKEMESNQYSTYASCNKCGAEGPYSIHDPIEANKKWNTRTQPCDGVIRIKRTGKSKPQLPN